MHLRLMIIVFVILNAFFLTGKGWIAKYGIDQSVVLIGNAILFLIGAFTLSRSAKAIDDPNPHVFVRVFYSGFIIRLFACAIAAFIYISLQDGKISKASLFACLAIYILYSVIEVSTLKKLLNDKKKNG